LVEFYYGVGLKNGYGGHNGHRPWLWFRRFADIFNCFRAIGLRLQDRDRDS